MTTPRPWFVKRREPESIMARYPNEAAARNLALELNLAYQTDDYYAEEWDPARASLWPTYPPEEPA